MVTAVNLSLDGLSRALDAAGLAESLKPLPEDRTLAFKSFSGVSVIFSGNGDYLEAANAHLLRMARRTGSRRTRQTRSLALKRIISQLEELGSSWDGGASLALMQRVRDAMTQGGEPAVKKRTWNHYLRFWNAFMQDAARRGALGAPASYDCKDLQLRGAGTPRVSSLELPELRRFLDACELQRVRAASTIVLSSGMRAEELSTLKASEVPNFDELGEAPSVARWIVGKGAKERQIRWTSNALRQTHAYIKFERLPALQLAQKRAERLSGVDTHGIIAASAELISVLTE